jgi:centromere/kinetochore protein ZW10
MANEIERQSEAPDVSGEAVQDAEEKAEFLNREVQYSQQLHDVLQKIKLAGQSLDEAEEAYHKPSIHDSLVRLKGTFLYPFAQYLAN